MKTKLQCAKAKAHCAGGAGDTGARARGSNSSCGAVGMVAGCFTESSSQDPDVWSVALQGAE